MWIRHAFSSKPEHTKEGIRTWGIIWGGYNLTTVLQNRALMYTFAPPNILFMLNLLILDSEKPVCISFWENTTQAKLTAE